MGNHDGECEYKFKKELKAKRTCRDSHRVSGTFRPCSGKACSKKKCEKFCAENKECNYYFYAKNWICELYKSCQGQKKITWKKGTVMKKLEIIPNAQRGKK